MSDDTVRAALRAASWIGPDEGGVPAEPGRRPAYLLRQVFDRGGEGPVRCFATAHGKCALRLSGS